MSENITHTAIADDCLRLLRAAREICPAFQEVARDQREVARLGGITRYGDRFTVRLLESFRARWPTRQPADQLEPKLAFVLGWLAHRAADRQMKPVFREADPDHSQDPTECSVYHDAFVFREVFAGGRDEPYHPAMFDDRWQSADEVLRALLQRALLELHTLIPDGDDIEGWLDRLLGLRQTYQVDRARYAEAILRPDPAKVQRFIVAMNFYDPADPIIVAARALQRGEPADVTAAADAPARSHYGQALQLGWSYLKAASDFFTGELSAAELTARLNIGRPGRDGFGV
jgi:hypothetical protein